MPAHPDLGAFISRCKVFGLLPLPAVAASPKPSPASALLSDPKFESQPLPEAMDPRPGT